MRQKRTDWLACAEPYDRRTKGIVAMFRVLIVVLFVAMSFTHVAYGAGPTVEQLAAYCERMMANDHRLSFTLKGAERVHWGPLAPRQSRMLGITLHVEDRQKNPWSIECVFGPGFPINVTQLAFAPDFCDCTVDFATPRELAHLNALAAQ